MNFSRKEIRDIVISTLVLAFAFSFPSISKMPEVFLVVGIAFLFHELIGHKFMAQRLGAAAEYRAWPTGLLLAILISIATFGKYTFAAPGAVVFSSIVRGRFAFTVHKLSTKDVGKIGLAGPVINIILGAVSLAGLFITGIGLLGSAAYINFFLALFNLLPIPPLDGEKVFSWNKWIWAAAIAIAAIGYFALLAL
jgi:Zn-dependent protease